MKPRLLITTGDCAGIGPELVLRALNEPAVVDAYDLRVLGNFQILERVAACSGMTVPQNLTVVSAGEALEYQHNSGTPLLINTPFSESGSIEPGLRQAVCGYHAATWAKMAVEELLANRADAMITAPLHKGAMHDAGFFYPGHTEMLAEFVRSDQKPCMAFYTPGLIISLATIHTPLSSVPQLLHSDLILHMIKLTAAMVQRLGKTDKPRIGVLGLNPHAGEDGLFGSEEQDIILPAIVAAQAAGIDTCGPLVPDTAFCWLRDTPEQPPFDAFVAMYHDQGLIPFKMQAFDQGVNVTLGLPIIRTSPDHGTAFDIAWQGKALPQSFFNAIHLAARLCQGRGAKKKRLA